MAGWPLPLLLPSWWPKGPLRNPCWPNPAHPCLPPGGLTGPPGLPIWEHWQEAELPKLKKSNEHKKLRKATDQDIFKYPRPNFPNPLTIFFGI